MKKTLLLLLLLISMLLYACAPQTTTPTSSPKYTVRPVLADEKTPIPGASSPTVNTSATPAPTPYIYISPEGDTIETRFIPPEGYARQKADGFGEFLRKQKLLPDASPVMLYNGEPSSMQNMHAAVLAIDVGNRDLQQCADAALRLRCEYLFSTGEYEKISYHLTNGDLFPYSEYRKGYRLEVSGNKTKLVKTARPDESYKAFRKYLDVLFNYASTRSLFPESTPVSLDDLQIGDIVIYAASPGHCLIVMDMCENDKGERAMLLGQGNMPAQQVHIVQMPEQESPWIFLNEIEFPWSMAYWTFNEESLRRMP